MNYHGMMNVYLCYNCIAARAAARWPRQLQGRRLPHGTRSLINHAVEVMIDEPRGTLASSTPAKNVIPMQELVLTSDLGSKLTVKAESSIDDHFVLQINDIGYHLPQEAANGIIALLKQVSKVKPAAKK
ncbi:MAG: hypothetical protein GYA24_01665 [Candidatus Lokiarchaeota archaeon]|nr:hypothetical protein [Candidatus Lokiarchaeota archaeon]